MGTELRVNTTFQNYRAQSPPAIPGLLHWAFYGSMGSANNGNLAPGGPASVIYGAPTFGQNFVTLGRLGSVATFNPLVFPGGVLSQPTILNPGNNYSFPQKMNYSGGGGSGATSTTTVGGGLLTGFSSHSGGIGYTTAPTPLGPYGNCDLLDTQITRATVFSAGWTLAAVCRAPVSGVPSNLFSDSYAIGQIGYPTSVTMQNTTSQLRSAMFAATDCAITLPSAATQWRFVAWSWSGGTTGTENLYSLSDNLAATPYTAGTGLLASTAQIVLGSPTINGNNITSDFAFSMVASGPLSQAALQPIYASVKSLLANRGIAVL